MKLFLSTLTLVRPFMLFAVILMLLSAWALTPIWLKL